jgi:inner membrane protein
MVDRLEELEIHMLEVIAAARRMLQSPAFKLCLIGFLILLLLLPLAMAGALVSEREDRARGVRNEVARVWGQPQNLNGPFLVVPYTIKVETKDGDKRVETIVERRAVFAPEQLEIAADSTSQVLHRGLYDVNVYTAKVAVSGRFARPDISLVVADPQTVRWNDAVLVLGLSDVSGLKEAASVKIDGTQDIAFAPSIGITGVEANGIHARLIDRTPTALGTIEAPLQAFTFQTALTFTGSGQLSFAPAARETRVAMNSDWPSPSFSGAFLPAERSVTDRNFTATWRIPHLARSVPQAWVLNDQGLERLHPHMFGVSFYQPVDFYDLVNRSVKYSVLFLAAAFMAVFLLETQSAKRVHWVQYLFTGFALTFFYVLLLSLAEHIGFGWSYLIASAATGGMLAVYVSRALRSTRAGLAMAGVFSLLYGILYLILRLEDYALLTGAILGFAGLTVVMFATLRVDWGGHNQPTAPASA